MPRVDGAVLGDVTRLAAVDRARQVAPAGLIPVDAVVRLAARLLAAPMGVVVLVSDQEEFRAGGYGLPAGLASRQSMTLEYSVGKYPVSAGRPVAFDDLRTNGDADLRHHPLGREYGVRAFVGVPLCDAADQPVGALVVLDTAVRRWTGEQRAALLEVAALLGPMPALAPVPAPASGPMPVPAPALMPAPGPVSGPGPVRVPAPGPVSGPGPVRVPVGVTGALAALDHASLLSFLAALLESMDTGVAAVDTEGRSIVVNRALRRLHHIPGDWTSAEVDKVVVGRLFQSDGTPMPWQRTPMFQALQGHQVRDAEVLVQVPGARPRTFVANAQPITTGDGQRLGAVAAMHEVTAVRRAERFRDCERRVFQTLAHAHNAADAGPAVLQAVATTLGWPHAELWLVDEVTGTLQAAATWTAPTMRVDDLLGATVIKGTGITGTVWATGEPLWVPDVADTEHLTTADAIARAEACASRGLHTVLAVPVGDGERVQGVLTCFADTPEYDEAELTNHLGGVAAQIGQALATWRANELAVQLERSKDDFITLVGHEMRTPLTSIASYTDLLLTGALERGPQDRQMLEAIARNTTILRSIIDDLLELAGLESGHLGIHVRRTDIAGVVRRACAAIEPAAVGAGVSLHLDAPEHTVVDGDPDRLGDVIDNLLSNAVKYSPDGGDVRVRLTERHGAVELTVTDTGIGIPADERGQLFRRFYRASNARDRGIPGTGLGLPVVRTIVEAHHGTVTMTPREPGTTVTIRLPQFTTTHGAGPGN